MKSFGNPNAAFNNIYPEDIALLLAASTDICLVIDTAGVIVDLSIGNEELPTESYADWVGKPLIDTVTVESRDKISALLDPSKNTNGHHWRQVNHPSIDDHDIPVQYSLTEVKQSEHRVVIGRYLGAMSKLQQQIVDAQQAMEKHYWRAKQLETRYLLIFRITAEPIFIVDSQTHTIIEANSAATHLLDTTDSELAGKNFIDFFNKNHNQKIHQLLAAVRATGQIDQATAKLTSAETEMDITASILPDEKRSMYLIRINPGNEGESLINNQHRNKLLTLVDNAPDGFIVTDQSANITAANEAFLNMIGVISEDQVSGLPLSKWLGRPGVDINVLIANLKEQGKIQLFSTQLQNVHGTTTEIEISAKSVTVDNHTQFAFIVRDVSLRLDTKSRIIRKIPRPVQQMTELVGRVPLKQLVQESTNMIEKYCIEAALEITGDNRASAAEMLGLSRQSLYSKLHRYGLGDLSTDGETS